jgi:PAS domain S-box-containing protein
LKFRGGERNRLRTMNDDPVRAAVTHATVRLLEDLLHDAVTGMAIVGLDGRYAAVNPAMCRMLGRSERDLMGVRPADITHPDDRTVSEATMERLLRDGIPTDQLQKRYVRPDGTPVPVMRTTTVLRGEDDQPIGLFTQVVDMTEVAEAQRSVARSERRFKALVAHASELTLVLDSDGLITYASPAAESLVGYPAESLEGRYAFEFVP